MGVQPKENQGVSINYRILRVTFCLTKYQLLYKYYIPFHITRRANSSGVFEVESLVMMTKRILCSVRSAFLGRF